MKETLLQGVDNNNVPSFHWQSLNMKGVMVHCIANNVLGDFGRFDILMEWEEKLMIKAMKTITDKKGGSMPTGPESIQQSKIVDQEVLPILL